MAQGDDAMRSSLGLALAGLALLLPAALGVVAHGNTYSPRQYYGGYNRHPRGHYIRPYYYKPTPTYAGYKTHYAVYFPSRPRHVYMYNPYKKQYWGRCPTYTEGKPQYSLLAEKDRKGSVEDIKEESFPPPADVPPIPESKDGAKLELPPDDVPTNSAVPGK
jgi:hypothetical protein